MRVGSDLRLIVAKSASRLMESRATARPLFANVRELVFLSYGVAPE